eukprot:Gb_34598 [translate_table: standard]
MGELLHMQCCTFHHEVRDCESFLSSHRVSIQNAHPYTVQNPKLAAAEKIAVFDYTLLEGGGVV